MHIKKQKLIIVVGPTASGKTDLGITLAKDLSGEVISADSRQVYRGLNIGTGKVTIKEMDGIPHHLIDILNPDETYTASAFKQDAEEAIQDIARREHIPVIVGGTFFYIEALLGTQTLAEVAPDDKLRTKLDTYSTEGLFLILSEKNPEYANTIDRNNRHRLMRAIEIIETLGTMPTSKKETLYDAYIIGIDIPRDVLRDNIKRRLETRLKEGMLEEAKLLHEQGLSYERMDSFGLEYRYMAAHLKGDLIYEEMKTILEQKIWQYAKRQLTWLRKMKNVQWYEKENTNKISSDVLFFLKK